MIALIGADHRSSPRSAPTTPETRERLVELFGEPERWATTTTNFRWTQADVVVPALHGRDEFELPVACTYDLEVAASKYFHGLADGDAPLRFHFNGTVFYEADDGRDAAACRSRGTARRAIAMPVEAWKTDDRRPLPVPGLDPAAHRDHRAARRA